MYVFYVEFYFPNVLNITGCSGLTWNLLPYLDDWNCSDLERFYQVNGSDNQYTKPPNLSQSAYQQLTSSLYSQD